MASDHTPDFAGLLRRARREADLTQEALAERAGISVRGISDLERGIIRTPRRDTLDLLLDALDLPPETRTRWRDHRDEIASQPRSAMPAATNVDEPLVVGRDRELAILREQLDLALAGHGGLVLVSGEAGIGKTRLAEWIAAQARRHPAPALWGHCYEGEGAPAFWPWIQILRACLALDDSGTVHEAVGANGAHIAQILPEIEQLIPGLPTLPAMNPEQARFRLFDAVTRMLKHLASERPRLIILEDLHWADEPSLLLLQFLARELRQSHLLVLGTYRNVEVHRQHPLSQTLASLAREPVTQRITLRRFTQEEVGILIEQVSGTTPTAEMVQAIWRETEGNPFFVTEVVRWLDANALSDTRAEAILGRRIPESIREVIGQRLDQLSPASNELLTVAAVAGREFHLPILEQVTGTRDVDLLPLLDEAASSRIVEATATFGHYRFSHRLIQETLYDEIPTSRRLQLHAQIAGVIEERYAADLRDHYGTIAYHYTRAPVAANVARAVEYATKAAKQALRQVAWEQAVSYYELALQMLELQPDTAPEERCNLLLALGSAQDVAGSGRGNAPGALVASGAQATYWKAVEAARAAESPYRLAHAANGVSRRIVGAPFTDQRVVSLLEDVLAQLPEEDSVERALTLSKLAAAFRNFKMFSGMRFESGPEARIDRLSSDAIAMANRVVDPLVHWESRLGRGFAVWHPGRISELQGLIDELVAVEGTTADDEDLRRRRSRMYALLIAMECGEVAVGKQCIDELVSLHQEARTPRLGWLVHSLQAGIALSEGRFADAANSIEKTNAIWPGTGVACNQTFALCREQDRLQDAASCLQPILRNFPQSPWFRLVWILYLLETGKEAEARQRFNTIDVHDLADLARGDLWPHVLAICAELSVAFQDEERAKNCYELLEPFPDHIIYCGYIYYCAGSISHYLGLLASMFGKWDSAEAHFKQALASHQAMGFYPLVAHTQFAWAQMLLQRDASGDPKRASDLIDQALETAERLGMVRLARLVMALNRERPC